MLDVLDNPVWFALRGPLAHHAESSGGGALRFDPQVSVFAAVENLDAGGWASLAELVGVDAGTFLFRDRVPAPPNGWHEFMRIRTLQLVAGDLVSTDAALEASMVELREGDVPDMIALAQLTEPGPFLTRTPELGGYRGIREAGALVAMAGQRFQPPGLCEISAVCTHPDARRRGLGGALSLAVARGIRERGDEAFLHVVEENEAARCLYEALGFEVRRKVDVVGVLWLGDGSEE